MKQLDYAQVIKELRDKRGLTQQDAAELLGCSVPTISRIESGKHVPSYHIIETALQLLGENSQDFLNNFLDGNDKRVSQVIYDLTSYRLQGNAKKLMELIFEVEDTPPFNTGIHLQMLTFYKAEAEEGLSVEERLDKMLKAIKITKKNFKYDEINHYLLSLNEIEILGSMATQYYMLGKKEDAIRILYGIRESMNKFYLDSDEKARTYPGVLNNLAYILCELNRVDEAKDICEEAMKVSIRHKNPRYMPSILFQLSLCYFLKGDDHNLKEYTLRAYYTSRALENFAQAKEIAETALNKYKLDLKNLILPDVN